jgi:hypothetical protein
MLLPLAHLEAVIIAVAIDHDPRPDRTMPPGWSGECIECIDLILNRDIEYAQKWADWKEMETEYPRPASLDRVEWHVVRDEGISDRMRRMTVMSDDDEEYIDGE